MIFGSNHAVEIRLDPLKLVLLKFPRASQHLQPQHPLLLRHASGAALARTGT